MHSAHDSATLSGTDHISDEDYLTVFLWVKVMNYLSIFGCIFNLFISIVLKTHRNTVGKMVIGICIADLMLAVATLHTHEPTDSEFFCDSMTVAMQFGFGGSLGLICCFSHALATTMKTQNIEILESYWKSYVLIALSTASFIAVASVLTGYNHIDEHIGLCAHLIELHDFHYSDIVALAIPVSCAIVYCLCCYMAVINEIKRLRGGLHLELLLYPLILIVCDVPYTILGLLNQFKFALSYSSILICTILFYTQGFLNAFAYGLSKSIVSEAKKRCSRAKDKRPRLESEGTVQSISPLSLEASIIGELPK